jgi:hypothetical protein
MKELWGSTKLSSLGRFPRIYGFTDENGRLLPIPRSPMAVEKRAERADRMPVFRGNSKPNLPSYRKRLQLLLSQASPPHPAPNV